MADFHCPECNKPLARRARKDGSGYFWSCTGYPECKFAADDWREEPFTATCPECGKLLHKGISKSSGKPYTACLNAEAHAGKATIFFNDDGSVRGEKTDGPKAKGEFTCPECGQVMRYFNIKNGPRTGQTSFGCFNKEQHAEGKPLFWEDNNGRPLL